MLLVHLAEVLSGVHADLTGERLVAHDHPAEGFENRVVLKVVLEDEERDLVPRVVLPRGDDSVVNITEPVADALPLLRSLAARTDPALPATRRASRETWEAAFFVTHSRDIDPADILGAEEWAR